MALSTTEVEREWRAKARVIGAVVLVLYGLTIALSLLFDGNCAAARRCRPNPPRCRGRTS